MNISVKDMLISFVAGLVIFSLLMVVICTGIFNSEIKVAKSTPHPNDASYTIELHKAVVFTIPKKNGDLLEFSVLAMLDSNRNEIYLTPIYGDFLMNYRDSLSYVSSVYENVGTSMFPEFVKAFSGIVLDENDIIAFYNVINLAEFKTEFLNYFTENNGEFSKLFECDKQISDFKFNDFPIETVESRTEDTHVIIKTIDTEKTVTKFKSILG